MTVRMCDALSDVLRVCIGLFVHISSSSFKCPKGYICAHGKHSTMFNENFCIIYLGKKRKKNS